MSWFSHPSPVCTLHTSVGILSSPDPFFINVFVSLLLSGQYSPASRPESLQITAVCWQSKGYDYKHYSGGAFVIPYDPPYVPDENPCGAYYKDFDVSNEELEKDLYLYFEGVEAGFYVWVNGQFVGRQ